MANVTFDIVWREAMMDLLELLEAEVPDDPEMAPSTLEDWSAVYVRYLQIFRRLEEAYDLMVHPQKRADLRKALAAVMGRLLEVRAWIVHLNGGVDEVTLNGALVDLKLRPEHLEVPVPRLFAEEQGQKAADGRKLMEVAAEHMGLAVRAEAPNRVPALAALDTMEALRIIKCNERGRQGRERYKAMRVEMLLKRLEEDRERRGVVPNKGEAATLLQSAVRTFLARRLVGRMRDDEMDFLGMVPAPPDPLAPERLEAERQNVTRRKVTQRDNLEEYEEALVVLRRRVMEMEGQDMRETVQDAINAWFVDSRKPDGTYPEFPDEEDGGSKVILNPPPAPLEDTGGEDKKGAKGKGGKGKGKGGKEEAGKQVEMLSQFVPEIEKSVKEYVERWQDKDESGNFWQKYDPELVKEEVRPLVFEEVRVQVDEEMRVLLENLVDMVEAERAAQRGGKYKKKKNKKKKKKGGKKGGKKGKKYKDLTGDRDPIQLFTELVNHGIIRPHPPAALDDYLGSHNPVGGEMAAVGDLREPSMAQVRQLVTEYCVLPLGIREVHERAPYAKAVLLYGPRRCGKTMLARAVAGAAGAMLLDLSPTTTNGRYRGKGETAKMVHMVFKVARLYAPSVILVDHFEKVMVADRKRQKAWSEELRLDEPANRIKKDLAKEYKFNAPGDQVLILGLSHAPFDAAKKDRKAFVGFFQKHLYCPLPSYASRVLLWKQLFDKHGAPLSRKFDLPALAKVTEGYSSGDMDRIVQMVATPRRIERLHEGVEIDLAEVLTWMTRVPPVDAAVVAQFHQWTAELPARQKKEDDGKKGKGKGKK